MRVQVETGLGRELERHALGECVVEARRLCAGEKVVERHRRQHQRIVLATGQVEVTEFVRHEQLLGKREKRAR